jgi:outer membrane protein TolC
MLPLLKVESTALFWNDALEIGFNLPRELLDMLALINPNLNASIPPILVRERFTWQTTVTVIQPLTPLLTLGAVLDLKKAEIEAARVETRMERRKVAAEVEGLYLNALKADGYLQVLDQADLLLETQRERVRALIEAKVAIPAELARLDAAQAELDAQRARALSAILLSRQALAYLLGDPLDRYYRLSLPGVQDAPPTEEACAHAAMRERPEFELLRARRRQVHEGRQAQKWDLLPRVVALTQYKFSEGFGDFEPRNQWFAGLALSWELQWTEKWRELDKLELVERELDLHTEKAERGIRLEVSQKHLELVTARAVFRARQAAERAALVSHGTQVKLFGEKLATNADVLTAHTEWLRARVERENAQWDELAAGLAYVRTCGR